MGRGADLIEAGNRGLVVDRARKRAPDKELVEAAIAAIGIAADQIHVQRLEIFGGIDFARDHVALEVFDVARKQRFDPVGVGFAHFSGPAPVGGDRDLAFRVAFQMTRRLRELQPEDRFAGRRA